MNHLSQTIWIQRKLTGEELEDGVYQGDNETDAEFKTRIEEAISSAVGWYANYKEQTVEQFLDSTVQSGSDKPFDEVIINSNGENIIVSEKMNDDCQRVNIFNPELDDN